MKNIQILSIEKGIFFFWSGCWRLLFTVFPQQLKTSDQREVVEETDQTTQLSAETSNSYFAINQLIN